ncbi:Meiotic nuclear division protein 1 [Choanephora cucurbitarum]|uniref:Meiotic nuclear division protein 1 n=1 Tax=Choanephora cucurbitarum TaxID=101091 RepID=A0A1C7NIG9_9FUNG|nr:Meiotic nuclear division protein 1 [Choanephora cucurbitarum]
MALGSRLQEVEDKVARERERQKRLKTAIEEAEEGRQETEERQDILNQLDQLKQESTQLQEQLKQYKENDPQLHQKKENAARVAKDAANRWTESVWEIQSFCVNRFGMERSLFDKTFGIKDDFDTIE